MKKLQRSFFYLAVLLGVGIGTSYAAQDVEIEENPLAGLQEKPTSQSVDIDATSDAPVYPPNLYLALSVEFPTAGIAYQSGTEDKFHPLKKDDLFQNNKERKFLGYFDNTKCYKFNKTAQAFLVSSVAQQVTSGLQYGSCNNGNETEEFSGNIMNWVTMSSIDILRYTLTGGNRAWGRGSDENAYKNGETVPAALGGGTYLRHSKVNALLRQAPGYGYNVDYHRRYHGGVIKGTRAIDFTGMTDVIQHLIPHKYIPDVVENRNYVNANEFYVFKEPCLYNKDDCDDNEESRWESDA